MLGCKKALVYCAEQQAAALCQMLKTTHIIYPGNNVLKLSDIYLDNR